MPNNNNNNTQGYSDMSYPYSNQAYSSSQWLEKEQARSRRSKWIVSGPFLYTALRGWFAPLAERRPRSLTPTRLGKGHRLRHRPGHPHRRRRRCRRLPRQEVLEQQLLDVLRQLQLQFQL